MTTAFLLGLLVLVEGERGEDELTSRQTQESPKSTSSRIPQKHIILPLGDSITSSGLGYKSYRYFLWKSLILRGDTFEFVGTLRDNYSGNPTWPLVNGKEFDRHHEGHWGWRADKILDEMDTWLNSYNEIPTIALVHLGTNDCFNGHTVNSTVDEIAEIVEKLWSYNPDMHILTATLQSVRSQGCLKDLNSEVASMVETLAANGRSIHLVDMTVGFNLDEDTHDGTHPNDQGSEKMASRWLEAMDSVVSFAPSSKTALINEVLFHPDPSSPYFSRRRKFVEICRPDPFSLVGCRLENDDGSFRLDFGEAFENTYAPYYSVKHKSTLTSDFVIWRRRNIVWVRELELKPIDGLAIICNETILDYVEWGRDNVGPTGPLHSAAMDADMWTQGTFNRKDIFIQTGSVNLGGGYVSPGVREGDSIGRDKDSTDTNSKADWSFPGGQNARMPTPSAQNLDFSTSPVINEVLFRPKPNSKRYYRRRIFVEIYRRDTLYSLNHCTIQNHNGSWRFDFDKRFDFVNNHYVSIKHKSTLNRESKLRTTRGILWMRDMPLDEVDDVALFCDGNMIDYVSWGNNGTGINGTLQDSAVANGLWSRKNVHVETEGIRRGASIGRDANSRNTHNVLDWSFPGGIDAHRSTPSARNEPTRENDTLLRLAVDNFNKYFGPDLVIESTELNGTVDDVTATSTEMMKTLALVTAASFEEKPLLVIRDDLTDELVTEKDLERMRVELESGIAVGDTRIIMTLYDMSQDRRVTTLGTMSAGGHSFSGTLLTYTQIPGPFYLPPSNGGRSLQDIQVAENYVSERRVITMYLWESPGFIVDIDYHCRGPVIFPLGCSISLFKGHSPVFGDMKVLSPVMDINQPPSFCKGESNYTWATGFFKTVKIAHGGESAEVKGFVGQSMEGTVEISRWCGVVNRS